MNGGQDLKQDFLGEAGKGTIAVSGAGYYYLTLNEWVAIATLIYIMLQIGLLLYKYYTIYKGNKGE